MERTRPGARLRICHALALFVGPFLLVPGPARAAPATACHCFTNRTFDPKAPSAADPYVLATARSSLLSAAYAVPKADLVQAVMSGTSPDDLWIAYWAGARLSLGPGDLLAARERKGSWQGALGPAGSRGLPAEFERVRGRGGTSAELAGVAVDDVLATRLAARPADLASLRREGATSPEVILATLLAPRLRITPAEVVARFRSGKVSWGILLDEAGMKPKDIDAVVRKGMR